MHSFLSAIDKLNAGVTILVGMLLMVVTLSVFGQVTVRFVLTAGGINISAPWTEELARYALIWMVFLGAGVGVRHAQMIALEFGVRKLPARIGIPVRNLSIVLCVAFFAMMVWVGISFVDLGRSETSPVLGITKDYVYWAMPVGAGLMIINSVALVIDTVLSGRDIRFAADDAPEV
ncbi:MAG: TRAP transporter small permease [Pseudotabrizicola sp.]|uniref:TRAP transporter small permease n=1 Tax=Pseudotabrizicola sp. TaxID=2939647 RepID=UPI0027219B35|nr:TRAP transporter small permease [Pseudotabrizicola sp.]MDO9636964.1 TRAP transporter small permease [Pseudotabrizicola sp.]